MLLTDYLTVKRDDTRKIAACCGVKHAVVRLPEDGKFDYGDPSHWDDFVRSFTKDGFTPVVLEPMPNELHDPIKIGSERRDEAIEKVLSMFPHLARHGIRTLCFNFMAHIGWLRTDKDIPERGGARVTGFSTAHFVPNDKEISEETLWQNYAYFLRAVLPEAEKYGITLALHPDDPPLSPLGKVSRIMISADNIERAVNLFPSPNLGLTFCQATFAMMGEDLFEAIPRFAGKIKFIHFRNAVGTKDNFRETFHDNGSLPMGKLLRLYRDLGIDVPIRVDHVPTLPLEDAANPGYDALGRLFAIGYLKGLLEGIEV